MSNYWYNFNQFCPSQSSYLFYTKMYLNRLYRSTVVLRDPSTVLNINAQLVILINKLWISIPHRYNDCVLFNFINKQKLQKGKKHSQYWSETNVFQSRLHWHKSSREYVFVTFYITIQRQDLLKEKSRLTDSAVHSVCIVHPFPCIRLQITGRPAHKLRTNTTNTRQLATLSSCDFVAPPSYWIWNENWKTNIIYFFYFI